MHGGSPREFRGPGPCSARGRGWILLVLATILGTAYASSPPAPTPPRGAVDTGYIILDGMRFRPGVEAVPSFAVELDGWKDPGNRYFLVRFEKPLGADQVRALEGQGARVLDSVSFYSQLVTTDPAESELLLEVPGVIWVGPWSAGMKASPELMRTVRAREDRGDTAQHFLVYPQRDRTAVDLLRSVRTVTDGTGGATWSVHDPAVDGTGVLRVTLSRPGSVARTLIDLARLPGVFSIKRWEVGEPTNSWNRVFVQGGTPPFVLQQTASVTYTGVPWRQMPAPGAGPQPGDTDVAFYPLHARGLLGDGECVAVYDTGLQRLDFFEPFRNCSLGDCTSPTWDNKVVCHYRITSSTPCSDEGDACSFHGTHTAGTVAGDLTVNPDGGYDFGDGIAPRAKLVMQDAASYDAGIERCPFDGPALTDLREVRVAGFDTVGTRWECRIHSDSWGNQLGDYAGSSVTFDEATWDASILSGLQQDWLPVIAAGNAGPAAQTLGQPSTAKNALTVGAADGGLVGNVDMLHFSSTGPTEDGSGRIKPDVVSTGCALSACGNDDDTYCDGLNGFVSGRGLSYKCGTSMATPTVAGAAALVRQYLREGWYPCGVQGCASPEYTDPSSALLKALIINGTHVPYGAHYGDALPAWGDPVPNARVGFGWVNLENSLYFDGDRLQTTILADIESTDGATGPGLETGSTHTYYLNVTGAEPLRITLAWTDPAGNTVGDALVNDLNLRVTAPDGTIYRGNAWRLEFLGQLYWYSKPDSTTPDNLNNVEAIYLPEPEAGIWTVRVDGASVPGRAGACDAPCSQGYALVASGHFRDLAADPGAGHLLATEYGISAGCDGDAYLDNGERATLQITVRNFGAATATFGAVTPFVAPDSKLPASYVSISPPTWLLGNVAAGAEATATFHVRFLEHPDNLSGEYLKLRINYGWNLATGHASEFLSIPLQASPPSSPFYNETFEGTAPGDPPAGWTTEWGNHTCSGSWCMPDTFSGWMPGDPPQVVSCDAEGPRDTVGQELKFGAGDCVTTIPCCQEEWAKGPNLFLLLNQMTELSYSHRLDSPSFLSGLYLDPDGSLSDNLHASKAKMPYSSTGNRPWDRYRADLRALQKIRGLYFNLEFYNGSAGSPGAGEQGSLIDDIRIDTFDYDPANADSGPPDPATPPAGATGVSVRPDLGWDHVPDHGGRTYAARVCGDPSCTDVIWSESGLTGNLISISPSLPSVQTHYWQTMVEDDCAVGDWGEIWSFTTAQADFDLGVPSGTIVIPRYSSEALTVTASWLNGYDGDVTFSCTNLPSNVDCSFTPNPVPWVDGTTVTTTSMTITAGSVATGNYSFQVVATGIVDGSAVTHSRTRTLQIEGGPPGEARSLRLTPQGDDTIQISWLSPNCDVQDYAVYMGDLDRLSSGIYSHDTRLTCSTGGAKSFSLVPGALATHDFEDGLQGWATASLGCASNLWKRTNTCAQQSWGLYFGNTSSCTYDTADRVCGAIVSPEIDLKGIDYATLAFDYRLDTERGSGYDVVRVEIRRSGTSTWSVLAHNQSPSTGGLTDDDQWHHASLRIDGYTGSNVEIRFTFDTVDEVGNDYRGFLVDNVTVGNQPENAYFLTTPTNVTFEGSYGPHPDGGERPPSGRACRSVQNTGDCN